MAKFKVGDRVRCLEDYDDQFTKDRIYVVSRVGDDRISVKKDDIGAPNGWCSDKFILATSHGPIRTITRREIVPGVYGGVSVDCYHAATGRPPVIRYEADARADSLREAAALFTQLAEVLEEQQGVSA